MMSKACLIYNTRAGKNNDIKKLRLVVHDSKLSVKFLALGSQLAHQIQRERQSGCDTIIAAGGDGTINAVAAELVGTTTRLGIIPMGTLNHFAKDLGIPLDPAEALKIIEDGKQRSIDVGMVNDQIFINNSSIGLYPHLLRRRDLYKSYVGKWPAATWAALNVIARLPLSRVTLMIGTHKLKRFTPLIFIGNNSYHLDQRGFSNRTEFASGKLSIYLIKSNRSRHFFKVSLLTLLGKVAKAEDLEQYFERAATVYASSRTVSVAYDGEVKKMKTPLRYSSKPGSLQVIVPKS